MAGDRPGDQRRIRAHPFGPCDLWTGAAAGTDDNGEGSPRRARRTCWRQTVLPQSASPADRLAACHDEADADENGGLADDDPDHGALPGAQGHADADLARAFGDGGVAVGGNTAPCAVSAGGAGAALGL